jgi:hypothetical protein
VCLLRMFEVKKSKNRSDALASWRNRAGALAPLSASPCGGSRGMISVVLGMESGVDSISCALAFFPTRLSDRLLLKERPELHQNGG